MFFYIKKLNFNILKFLYCIGRNVNIGQNTRNILNTTSKIWYFFQVHFQSTSTSLMAGMVISPEWLVLVRY